MTTVANKDVGKSCHLSPKVVPKARQHTVPATQQRQLQQIGTVSLKDKHDVSAHIKRLPRKTIKQCIVEERTSSRHDEKEKTVCAIGHDKDTRPIGCNGKEQRKTKDQQSMKTIANSKDDRSIRLVRSPQISQKKSPDKELEKEKNEIVKKDTSARKNNLNATQQKQSIKPTASALKNASIKSTTSQSRVSKSRSVTPTSTITSKSSVTSKPAVKYVVQTSRNTNKSSIATLSNSSVSKTSKLKTNSDSKPIISSETSSKLTEGRISRSRSNTPSSSVSSESATSNKTKKSSVSRSSQDNDPKNILKAQKTSLSEPTKNRPSTPKSVKSATVRGQTHSYMKVTQSAANRNISRPSTDAGVRKQTGITCTHRQASGTKQTHSRLPVSPDTSHSATSGSSHETSPESEMSPSPNAKSTTESNTMQTRTQNKVKNTSRETKHILVKKNAESPTQAILQSNKIISMKGCNKSATAMQLERKHSPREPKPAQKASTLIKSVSCSSKDKSPLKSKSTRTNDTTSSDLTSQKVIPGKRSANRTESKNLMTDKPPDSKLVKAICLQNDATDISKRSSSNGLDSRSTTHSSNLTNRANTDKRISVIESGSKTQGPGTKNRDVRQLKPGTSVSAKSEHKSKLIAPLTKNATNRLSKMSKRGLDIPSEEGRNVSKLKSLKSLAKDKTVESVPGVKVSKDRSETKKLSAQINKDTASTKSAECSDNKAKNKADNNKCTSQTEHKRDIKSNLSDMSMLSAENNETLEKPNCEDIRSVGAQTCDLCSETRNISDSRDLSETGKLCDCSPISQNYMKENNQCSLSEKMEFTENSSTDIVYIATGSNDAQNIYQNDSVNKRNTVTMETGSAEVLQCNEMQMHQHVLSDRCEMMDTAVSANSLAGRMHEPCTNEDTCVDYVDGYCFDYSDHSLKDSLDKMSANLELNDDSCLVQANRKKDNSSETALTQENSIHRVISLNGESLVTQGKICQLTPHGENLSPVCKNEAFYLTSEILSSTDSGFFTNENSGQTSFISSASKNGEDDGFVITHDTNDSYDGNHYRTTNCDNYQTTATVDETNLLSNPCVDSAESGIHDEAYTDNIVQTDLEISNLAELLPTSQTDKQPNIADIMINGMQDLNPNVLRNKQNETGCVCTDREDKGPSFQASYPGGLDEHSTNQIQSYEQMANLNTTFMCGDKVIDNNNKTRAPGQELFNMETQVAGNQLHPDYTECCEDSDSIEHNLLKGSNENQEKVKHNKWQDKKMFDTGDTVSELSVLPDSCLDLNSPETKRVNVNSQDEIYSFQSSLSEIDENSNKKQMCYHQEDDNSSCVTSDSNGLNVTSNTNSMKNETCTEEIIVENDSFQNKRDNKMSHYDCNRLSLQEEINNALLLSPDIHDKETQWNNGDDSITYTQRHSQQSDTSTYCDNIYSDENYNSVSDVNGLEPGQIRSEGNNLSLQPNGTGESKPRRSTSIDSTCSQNDSTLSLFTDLKETQINTSQMSTPPHNDHNDCTQHECSENRTASSKNIQENEFLNSQITENIANYKSSSLLVERENKIDSNCSQLPEICTESEQGNILEMSRVLTHSPACCSQEIIAEIASTDYYNAEQSNMKINPVTSSDPDDQILPISTVYDEHDLNVLQLNTYSPETININFLEAGMSPELNICPNDHASENCEPSFQDALGCNNASTQAQNVYTFNKHMGDSELPLKSSENTLHHSVSQHEVGDQIKHDSTSINMNGNLQGSKINDLSSYVDSSEPSAVYLDSKIARELGGSRDLYFKQADDSTGSGVIEINNHIMNQDFNQDQMSSLSALEHTTQKSSCNLQEYSGNFSEPQDFMLRDDQNKKCTGNARQLTPADDRDTCTHGSKPCNKSRLYKCRHDDRIKSEFHINTGNYDRSLGILRSAEEECCAICFECIEGSECEPLYDKCGFTQSAEIIRHGAKETSLQNSVVNIFSGKQCDIQQIKGTHYDASSEISTKSVLQDREYTGDNGELCKTGGLDSENTGIRLEDDCYLIETSTKTDNNELHSGIISELGVSQNDCLSDSSECLTQTYVSELTDDEDDIQSLNSQHFLKTNGISGDQVYPASNETIFSGVVYQKERLAGTGDKFRKTSIDLSELCLRTAELIHSNRGEQGVIRSKNFESETESGESGSTESESNNTEVEYSGSGILATAGEALCESLSPTEVASILDDTSDSYVDATETLEYETDGELSVLTTHILNTDKRRSGDYSFHNVCESTSTESFQDAVETFDDGRHSLIRSPDVTLRTDYIEDEDSLSQISLPLSDASSGSSTSLENLNILGELSDESSRGETDNDGMESNGRPKVSTFRSHTVTRSSLKHVQTSEYRTTKSVMKDNLYRTVANSSQHKDSLPQVGTNVLRSTDTECESGHQIIKNVIYNTGNRIFHSNRFTQHETGANCASGASHNRNITPREGKSWDQDRDCVKAQCDTTDGDRLENGTYSDSDKSDSYAQSNFDYEQSCDSSESSDSLVLSVSPTQRVTDNMSDGVKSPVDVSIGLKIETAMTIRTERRRLRRRQKQLAEGNDLTVKVSAERIMKSDTQCITQECAEGFTRDNAAIYESPEITFQNSSRITHESCTVSSADEPSNCIDEKGDIKICKQSAGHYVSTSNVTAETNLPETGRHVSEVPPILYELQDQTLEKPIFREEIIIIENGEVHAGQSLCDSVHGSDALDGTITTGVCSEISGSSKVAVIEKNKTITSTAHTKKESDGKDKEKTYTFYVQSGVDTDFDDIQFIDDEEHAEGSTCPQESNSVTNIEITKDQTPLGPIISSPNASFMIEYSGEEDNCADHLANENIQSQIVNIQGQTDAQPKQVLDVVNDAGISVDTSENEMKLEYKSMEESPIVTREDNVSTAANLEEDAYPNNNNNIIENIDIAEDVISSTEETSKCMKAIDTNVVSVEQNDMGECNSEIIEESNISVKQALRMERRKLNDSQDSTASGRSTNRNNTNIELFNNTVRKSKSDDISKMCTTYSKPIKKSLSFRTEKEQILETNDQLLANKKVSDICRSFIDKVRPVAKPLDDREAKSPVRQRKLMKWVRGNGKWLRIPVSEAEEMERVNGENKLEYEHFASELNTPTEEANSFADDVNVQMDETEKNTDIRSIDKDTAVIEIVEECVTKDDSISNAVRENSKCDEVIPEPTSGYTASNEYADHNVQGEIKLTTDVQYVKKYDNECNECSTDRDTYTTIQDNDTNEAKPANTISDENTNEADERTEVLNELKEDKKTESITLEIEETKPNCKISDVNDLHVDSDKLNVTGNESFVQQLNSEKPVINYIEDTNFSAKTDVIETSETVDVSENVSETRLQRQELLFGIRDNYNRRKHKPTRNEGSIVPHKANVINDENMRLCETYHDKKKMCKAFEDSKENKMSDSLKSSVEIPKAIPKLKAVKIQEEIFEGNPEYMKECNKKPSWSESGVESEHMKQVKDIIAGQKSDSRLKTVVQLRKSKTFSGIGDFEHKKRESLYMTIATSKVTVSSSQESLYMTKATSKETVNSSQESLDIPHHLLEHKTKSAEDIAELTGDKCESQKEYTKNEVSKIPWYSNKARRSRENDKSVNQNGGDDIKSIDEETIATAKTEKKRLKFPVFSRAKSLQRRKLLSEIVEVEENKDESPAQISNNAKQSPGRTASTRQDSRAFRPAPRGNKRRSLSLPTGTLAFGEARIVYKNGHFTIETMDGTEIDSTRPPDPRSESQYNQQEVSTMLVTSDSREISLQDDSERDTTLGHKPHMKRQRAKSYLNRSDSSEDVFYDDEEEIENISPNTLVVGRQAMRAEKMAQQYKLNVRESDPDSSHISETSLECSMSDRMDVDTDSDRSLSEKSCSSLPNIQVSDDIVHEARRVKRTSSFRRAQQCGLSLAENSEDIDIDTKSDSKEIDEDQTEDKAQLQNQPNSTFLQKMMAKRKPVNETASSKQSESAKDFFTKKMTLKGLFKKNKSESSVGSPLKLQHPVSPPIAAFQGDDDIGSIDTPPGSPFLPPDLRRRHTSADIYIRSFAEATATAAAATAAATAAAGDSNCPTPTQERSSTGRQSLSSPSTPSHESMSLASNTSSCALSSREEDQISITSGSSATSSVYSIQSPIPLEQPNKPKTPKPVGASPRRYPSYSSHLGRTGSVSSQRDAYNSVNSLEGENVDGEESVQEFFRCECEHRAATLPRQRKPSDVSAKGSSESLLNCPYCKQLSNYSECSGGGTLRKIRKRSMSSSRRTAIDSSAFHRQDSNGRTSSETLGILSQADVVSSNSNDSGIQRDGGVNSSNESIKGISDGPVKLRRRTSTSPQPERPKSEVGVRWADLDTQDHNDVTSTPIKMRQRDQNIKDRPRPKSDFEDNIHLFDELFEEVLEDFVTEGSSYLSDRLKTFGSERDLQPYCSLRNLYEMRRRELDKQKNRRMSTPHPIKSRLQRVPRKQQKQQPLVRSNSMPESLEKIHKRRKLHDLNFPLDTLSQHMCPCVSDDSDISFDNVSLQEKSDRLSQGQLSNMDEEEDNLTFAEALWDHITMDPEELGFRAQDVIEVVDMSDKDWWFGAIDDHEGWFPAAFVRLRVNQDQLEDDLDVTLQENLTTSPKLRRISMFNKNQARTNVVNEIINAEREYVKHLKDVVEGYIQHARKRKEMFSDERILLIFGNIEDIYSFACKFLAQLEMCIDICPHLSEIGQCLLDNDKGFEIYSDYCNNHPSACEELKELCKDSKYKHFFEACRLLQDLVEIPLEGFLLTPVQKICKYPLQLAELLKYTPPEHPDYEKVKDGLAAMRKIATLINERKRKMESIEKIAVWQHSVVDWEGNDLLDRSSELIFSGELNKINTAGWSQERYFFLFDHQLIYCKKELLKRHVFSYKGRIDLDHCEIVDVPDGKDVQYNVTVKHGWKLHETHKDKWYLLYAKSTAMKERWMKAITDERRRVQEDRENEFCMPDHWKQTVLNKVKSQSNMKDKQQTGRGHLGPSYQKSFPYSTLPRRPHGAQKTDKKKSWFPFGGGGKKTKR